MSRGTFMLTAGMAAATFLAGCGGAEPGTTYTLGAVSYESAFATSREVLSQHFSVLPSDPGSGVLTCRPKPVEAETPDASGRVDVSRGLLGLTSAGRRQTATLRLLREGKLIVAHLAVTIEQRGDPVYRGMPQPDQEYSSVPNLSPAEETAATTPDQNDVWRPVGRDEALERTILDDIRSALAPPAGKKPPAKAPKS